MDLVLKEFEWQLTRHKSLLLQYSHLNPQWKSLKDGRRGVRWLFQGFSTVQHEKWARELTIEGTGGVFIPPLQKLAAGARGAWKLQAYVWILRTLEFHSGLREIY
jgi:hypothetical protein